MNVLLVTESYWPNADGGALFERRLVLGMVERGHHVEVWAPGNYFLHSYDETDGPYVIHREKSTRFIFNPKYRVGYWPYFSVRKVILKQKPDVIHIHNFGVMGLAALFWAKIYKIPVLGTNHFMPENALLNVKWLTPFSVLLTPLIWSYLVFLHNRCNFVTSPSKTAVGLLIDHGLKVPSEAITNGIDTAVFKPGLSTGKVVSKYHLPKDKPLLLCLGRVDGEKRIDLIVSAMTQIDASAHLVIAGFGIAMADLKKLSAKLGVADRITFTGYIDDDDKAAIYNTGSIFVMASPAELQGIVMLEAMSTSLPLIAVDVAAISELCQDNVNGYLFKRDDWHTLANKVNELLSDKTKLQKFGASSRKIVEAYHSTTYTFDRYEAVYKKLTNKTAD